MPSSPAGPLPTTNSWESCVVNLLLQLHVVVSVCRNPHEGSFFCLGVRSAEGLAAVRKQTDARTEAGQARAADGSGADLGMRT